MHKKIVLLFYVSFIVVGLFAAQSLRWNYYHNGNVQVETFEDYTILDRSLIKEPDIRYDYALKYNVTKIKMAGNYPFLKDSISKDSVGIFLWTR